ncbi:hypothetical protein GCM10009558_063390 [Virgisporangium aurantiacum]
MVHFAEPRSGRPPEGTSHDGAEPATTSGPDSITTTVPSADIASRTVSTKCCQMSRGCVADAGAASSRPMSVYAVRADHWRRSQPGGMNATT